MYAEKNVSDVGLTESVTLVVRDMVTVPKQKNKSSSDIGRQWSKQSTQLSLR